jgi:hypothetical protein
MPAEERMKGINHLVLAGHDLDALGETYQDLGFTISARGQHPFGTGNTIIQLHGAYLELLAVTIPQDATEHTADSFSFAAFNRDYLARHEGFSMLVLDSEDALQDIDSWRKAGLRTYQPFEFSRMARMANGDDVRVGFSLAFVSNPAAPWLGLFACQHYAPAYFAQPELQKHANTAQSVEEVWVSGPGAEDLAGYFATVAGADAVRENGRRVIQAAIGAIILSSGEAFEDAFGTAPPHPGDGPHLAGFTIACRNLGALADKGLDRVGSRLVLPPSRGFGTALAFRQAAM